MRSGVLTNLVMLVLCACVAMAEQSPPSQLFAGDITITAVHEPNASDGRVLPLAQDAAEPWNPSEHLVATWESLSTVRTHQIYNPALQPLREPEGPGWMLSLAGRIDVTDSNGVVGFSAIPAAALALDQEARLILSESIDCLQGHSYQPLRRLRRPTEDGESISEIQPYPFSVNLPVAPDTTWPPVLGTFEWSMHALVADDFTIIDIPFQAGPAWIELVPGLEILVEQAVAETVQDPNHVSRLTNGRYEYRLRARHGTGEVFCIFAQALDLQTGETPPRVIVVDADVLDAEGRSIRTLDGVSGRGGVGTAAAGAQATTLIRGTATGPACDTAAVFRFQLALNAHARHIRFILENAPLPSFRD